MLSNAYFLAKFRFDTAENEPAKNPRTSLPSLGKGGPYAEGFQAGNLSGYKQGYEAALRDSVSALWRLGGSDSYSPPLASVVPPPRGKAAKLQAEAAEKARPGGRAGPKQTAAGPPPACKCERYN